jgi:hypothetical protein
MHATSIPGGLMAQIPKIVEVVLFGGKILVTFSDGRMATLNPEEIYAKSVEAPPNSNLPNLYPDDK